MHSKVSVAAAAALIAGVSLASAPSALAHHSYAMFDRNTIKSMDGSVREFEWTNPHAYLWVNAVDAKGAPQVWAFEFIGGVNMLARAGWMKDTLKPGDKITVKYNPLKEEGKPGGEFSSALLPDGMVWDSKGLVPPGGRPPATRPGAGE
jgi:hypothetical protein